MKLKIKWASIDVENEEHALGIVELIEATLNEQSSYFKWDWEVETE